MKRTFTEWPAKLILTTDERWHIYRHLIHRVSLMLFIFMTGQCVQSKTRNIRQQTNSTTTKNFKIVKSVNLKFPFTEPFYMTKGLIVKGIESNWSLIKGISSAEFSLNRRNFLTLEKMPGSGNRPYRDKIGWVGGRLRRFSKWLKDNLTTEG